MPKSTEKGKKKYADTYKWTDDEVELLLTVTKEYKTKQIAKSIDWESCVDKYGEILGAYSALSITWPEAWRAHEIAQRMRQVIAHVRCIKQVDF